MLDEADTTRLRYALRRQRLAAAAFAATPLLLGVAAAALHFQERSLARGPIWVLALACAWWMWLLRRAPGRAGALHADLADGAVATVEGIAAVASRRGFGLFAPSRWRLVVAGREFDAGAFALADLHPGNAVVVRHAARSGELLRVVPAPDRAPAEATDLTARERVLLRLLVAGLSDKLIARELALAPATVRTYNSALFRKLGVADRRAAIAWAGLPANAASIGVD